ncbi:MAG: hypothetical protein ACLS9T_01725 [Streptococcus salivarius]
MENHNYENEGQFQRKMTSRHLFMLSLGGVIGTGLFLAQAIRLRKQALLVRYYLILWGLSLFT